MQRGAGGALHAAAQKNSCELKQTCFTAGKPGGGRSLPVAVLKIVQNRERYGSERMPCRFFMSLLVGRKAHAELNPG